MKVFYYFFFLLMLSSCISPVKKEQKIQEIPVVISNNSEENSSLNPTQITPPIAIDSTSLGYKNPNEMTVEILERLVNFSRNKFENWATDNGYYYDETKSYEFFDVAYYRKSKNFISLSIPKDIIAKPTVQFETANKSEYSEFQIECKERGYDYLGQKETSHNGKSVVFEIYQNSLYKLSFNEAANPKSLGYSIVLERFE